MISGVVGIQALIVLLLSVAAFGVEVYALVDAIRTRADAFAAAGKLTRNKWLAILAVAAILGFLSLPYPVGGGDGALGFLGLIAVVAAIVYMVDVRPAVRQLRGGGSGGNSGRMGPYGPW
jgi:Protein of unknown function (DUF2516)